MSLWSGPPPPQVIGPVNSTLPIPHAPISVPPQAPPPLRPVAVAMAIVLASWPQDLEPRLQAPNNQQNKIAPLTLTYGQQPVPRAQYNPTLLNTIVSSWPVDVGPLVPRPDDQQQKIVPLTLTYGNQPVPSAFYSPTELNEIVTSWPPDTGPLVPWPDYVQVKNAAVIPPPPVNTYVPIGHGIYPAILQAIHEEAYYEVEVVSAVVSAPTNPDQPPRIGAPIPAPILQSWQPPDPMPWQRPPSVAAILPTGTAPIPNSFYSPTEIVAIVGAWPIDVGPVLPRFTPPSVVPSFPVVSQPPITRPIATPTYAGIVSSWAQDWGAQSAPKSIPATQGTAPIPSGPLSVTEVTSIVGAWAQDWPAQKAAPNAGWNVPPVLIVLPYAPPQRHIWTAWEPPFVAPPKPVQIAPLTLVYGQQPTPTAPLSVSEVSTIVSSWPTSWDAQTGPKSLPSTQGTAPVPCGPLSVPEITNIVAAWPTAWDAQKAAPNASWNVPPVLVVLPYVAPPRLLWTAWEPAWVQPPVPVAIAPLTLPTGQQPVPSAFYSQTELAEVVGSWAPDAGQPPRTPPVAALIPAPPSFVPAPSPQAAIWQAWTDPGPRLPALTGPTPIPPAPPPPVPVAAAFFARLVAAWTQDWPAQTAAPVAAWYVPPSFIVIPRTPLPRLIWTAWEPDPPMPWHPWIYYSGGQPPGPNTIRFRSERLAIARFVGELITVSKVQE